MNFRSSASIQKEYVEKRQRHLYKNDDVKTAAVKQEVEALMRKNGIEPLGQDDWKKHYDKICDGLKASSLTINFDAGAWFLKDNHYPTYTQMYEKAVGPDGKMVLNDNDPENPAITRAVADDLVTLPDEWANAHPFSQRRRLYDALSATGANKSSLREAPKNRAPKLKEVTKTDTTKGYVTKNKSFKPRAKQVFAALNYGMRPHGSCTLYGYSHLVLKPELKVDALYYPSDTFSIQQKGTETQAAYHTIGMLLTHAGTFIANAIWKSCHDHTPLEDTQEFCYLLEAHIFKTIRMNKHVKRLVLSRQRKVGDQNNPWTGQEWDTIKKNATNWCERNAVELNYASP